MTVASWRFINTLPIIICHISKTKQYTNICWCHTTGNTGQVKFDLGRGVICSHDLPSEHSFSVHCIYVLPGICILKKPCYPPTINKHALKRETSKQDSHFSSLSLSIPSHIQLHCSPSAHNSVDKPPLGHAQKERGTRKAGCGKKKRMIQLTCVFVFVYKNALTFISLLSFCCVFIECVGG